ncbi:TnsD family Tn7-like transposition protein [Rugamonas sp. DEMB1]|uniref:TnsD family Tn7-like transposition protein n=1 Tax=Rugamonas sp. DEMB1 TaxID=3039386 RepID=UPI0024472051|nr:TnsD family Tn7-like transposition protein [Rugamonas sp. DEMB1]WGG50476.1 TnsD family Tn7-like transposition protein [Rugamonas sp. DEMB1]
MSAIHFFPQSLSDETLSSRVARYHLMVGNRSSARTFKQLFEQPNFSLEQIVPPHLETLAASMPGEPTVILQEFLNNNTLLPLFQPFLGKRGHSNEHGGLINRLPRRVVGKHGDAYLCVQCTNEAAESFGFGYWHRSHQAPGVTACWKHGTLLLSSCPNCRLPFQRSLQLLEVPWLPCAQCGYEISRDSATSAASKNQTGYAVFVHELLNANVAPVAPDHLAQVYRQRIQKIGFVWGKPLVGDTISGKQVRATSMTAFTADFIEYMGGDFIAQVDPAYAAGRTTNWLRFSTVDGVMDMPVTRHILLAMRLFGTAAHFVQAIKPDDHEATPKRVSKARNGPLADAELRDQYRQRILREIKMDPVLTLEGLWRKAYRPTTWLFEHDKKWLDNAFTYNVRDNSNLQETTADELVRDQKFAEKVEAHARKLVSQSGKPNRITMQKLIDHIPLSYSHLKLHADKFPQLNEVISLCKESSWSFSARRILWAIEEVQRLGLSLKAGSIVNRTSVSLYVIQKICQFAGWDLEGMARQPINIPVELARAGITLTWQVTSLIGVG